MRIRLFVMMLLQLAIWGAWAPKLFPYMAMLHFAAGQQALIGSCWGISTLVGIFFSNQIADRHISAERLFLVSHLAGGLALLGVAYSHSFAVFLTFFLVYSLAYVPTLSIANAIAFEHLDDPVGGFGIVRVGGTIGWVLVSWPFVFLLSTHATLHELRWIFFVPAMLSLLLAAYSLTLPVARHRIKRTALDPLAWRRVFGLLRTPFVAVLFIVTLLDSIVHNGYYVVSDAFLTNRVGIAGNLSMIVLSLGQVSEIATMLVLGTVLRKLGWKTTMVVGILGHAARFTVFALFADSVPLIVAVQFVHGICYAFFFATLYIFVDEVFPHDARASAQGMFNMLILGAGNVIASFVFSALIAHYTVAPTVLHAAASVDYQRLFMVPTGLSLVAAVLLAVLFRPTTARPAAAITAKANKDSEMSMIMT